MPTANRKRFIPLAIEYFLRQDYPCRELIILDDGISAIDYLVPENDSIHYYRLKKANVIGTKRNIACDLAKGEIIVHWDDDDWYANNWITSQVNTLAGSAADICGLDQLLFYAPIISKSWKYIYPNGHKNWVGGATMAYRKSFWRNHPFLDLQVGEDNQFAWNSGGEIVLNKHINGFVSILHSANTSPKNTGNHLWNPNPYEDIATILRDDLTLYAANRW